MASSASRGPTDDLWADVKELLPELDVYVECATIQTDRTPGFNSRTGWRFRHINSTRFGWADMTGTIMAGVTHWRPLGGWK